VLLYDFKKGRRGPVSNWSGPVWVLSSYYLAEGLSRYGFGAQARELAVRTARLLAGDLQRTGALHECWNDAGVGLWPPERHLRLLERARPLHARPVRLNPRSPDVRRPGTPATEYPGLS
jgi:hypothetical protein